MNLQELLDAITALSLTHKSIKAALVGNTFDIATSKSSENYPAMWCELPILIDYNAQNKKTYTFALNFLTLCKSDDINDAIAKTSDMETVADEMLQAINFKFKNICISNIVGLTLRSFSDDDLVGVRVELTFTIGRTCGYNNSFYKPV